MVAPAPPAQCRRRRHADRLVGRGQDPADAGEARSRQLGNRAVAVEHDDRIGDEAAQDDVADGARADARPAPPPSCDSREARARTVSTDRRRAVDAADAEIDLLRPTEAIKRRAMMSRATTAIPGWLSGSAHQSPADHDAHIDGQGGEPDVPRIRPASPACARARRHIRAPAARAPAPARSRSGVEAARAACCGRRAARPSHTLAAGGMAMVSHPRLRWTSAQSRAAARVEAFSTRPAIVTKARPPAGAGEDHKVLLLVNPINEIE